MVHYNGTMIEDLSDFNEAWDALNRLDKEAPIDSVVNYLFKEFFESRYHNTKLVEPIVPDEFSHYHWRGVCQRCKTKVDIKIQRWGNTCHYTVGSETGIYLAFTISEGWSSNVTLTRSRIPFCKKLLCLL